MAESSTTPQDDSVKTLQRKSNVSARVGSIGALVEALKTDPLYASGLDVVLWNDPVRSGLVFAIVLLSWFLLTVANYSIVTLIAYLYLGTWAISFGLVQYSNFSNKPHLLKARLGEISDIVTIEECVAHAQTSYRVIDSLFLLARDSLFFTDVAFSLKAFGLAFVLGILGNIFSLPSIAFIGAVLLFTLPRAYKEKGAQIDAAIAQVTTLINEKLAPVLSKVPLDKMKLKQE